MKNIKNIVLGFAISAAMVSTGFMSACSETKEVKVTEEVKVEPTPVPVVEADKDVNVNVKVEQPPQVAVGTETKKTEVTNIVVDKADNSRLNNDMATVNANLAKLQSQVKTANDQSKAQLNKQIQQMNLDKLKLQKEIAAFQVKNKELTNIAQQQKANMEATKANMEKNSDQIEQAKQDYIKLAQTRLDNFQTKMDTLKDKVSYLEATEKSEVDKQITKLDEKKDTVNQKISDLSSVSDSSGLRTMRSQIDTMMADLERSYTKLVSDKVSLR